MNNEEMKRAFGQRQECPECASKALIYRFPFEAKPGEPITVTCKYCGHKGGKEDFPVIDYSEVDLEETG